MKKIIALLLLSVAPAAAGMADREAYIRFMNGVIQERRGNFDAAMQEYGRVLLLSGGEPAVLKQAANLALHIGRLEDAARWTDYLVKADSATAENWVLFGNARWARGDNEAARQAYEKASALDPQNHEAFYQLASLVSSRDQDKAIAYLKKYMEVRSEDSPDILYQIAVLYNMKGDKAGAEKYLLDSKAADSFYLQPRYMLASLYENRADTAAALGEYLGILELDRKTPDLFNHVGEIYASPAVADFAEAEKYFAAANAMDKGDPNSSFWLSALAEERRDYEAAAAYLEGSRALKEDPSTVLRLSYHYTQSGRYPKAVALLESANKKWQENKEIAYFLALGYDDTGRTPKALELLRALVRREPDYFEARMQLGVIAERENNMPEAEAMFRYLVAKHPGNANVHNYLGYSLADRGMKLPEARLFIEKAVALEPGNGAYRDSLAWVHFKLGETGPARDEILKAIKAIPDDPVIWAHAGDIYAALGEKGPAWTAYKSAWLYEKPAKRQPHAQKAAALLAALPAAEAAALERAWLRRYSPAGRPFSSFAKVQAKVRGKSMKFDAVLQFAPPDAFSFTLMGPLMMPLWSGRSAGGMLELDQPQLEGVDPVNFSYWAGLMTSELVAWFSGAWLDDAAPVRGKECAAGTVRELCMDRNRGWAAELSPLREKRLTLTPDGYFLKNNFLFARTLEFKIPFVSVQVTLEDGQMNFEGVNEPSFP